MGGLVQAHTPAVGRGFDDGIRHCGFRGTGVQTRLRIQPPDAVDGLPQGGHVHAQCVAEIVELCVGQRVKMLADNLHSQRRLGVAAVLKLGQQAFAQIQRTDTRWLQLHKGTTDLLHPFQAGIQPGGRQATCQIDRTLFQVAGLVQGIEHAQGNLQIRGVGKRDGDLLHQPGAQVAISRAGLTVFRNVITGRCTQDRDVVKTLFSRVRRITV